MPSLIRALRGLVRKLTLLDHGTHLLRPGAATWIASMGFLALAMALLEGFAWFKILGSFLSLDYAWVALCVGVIWGVGVWIIDAGFVTMDTAARKRKQAAEQAASDGKRPWWKSGFASAIGVRLSIVVLSMALTGPFLARALDERTVLDDIQKHNDGVRAVLVDGERQHAQARIDELARRTTEKRDELVREIGGHGKNGGKVRGDGPVAKALRQEIDTLKQESQAVSQALSARVEAIAAMSLDDLERQERADVWHDNATVRAAVRRQREADGDHLIGLPVTHVLASALFLMLFLLMLVMKIYQPRSVSNYYDDTLQEAYDIYLAGGFDHLPPEVLSPAERHDGPAAMKAGRFARWYLVDYPAGAEAIRRAALDAEQEQARCDRRDGLITLAQQLAREEEARCGRIARIETEARRLADQAAEAELHAAQVHRKLASQTEALDAERAKAFREQRDRIKVELAQARARQSQVQHELSFEVSDAYLAIIQKMSRMEPLLTDFRGEAGTSKRAAHEALQQQKDELVQRQCRLEAEHAALGGQVNGLQADLRRLAEDPESARPTIDRAIVLGHLQDDFAAHELEASRLRDASTRLDADVVALRADLARHQARMGEVHEAIRAIDGRALGLSGQ